MIEQEENSPGPLRLLYSYAREDKAFFDRLLMSLKPLERGGVITTWYTQQIPSGAYYWAERINGHLETADIILLLISPDFLASNYVYSQEMALAITRHERGEARVVSVILRPVNWELTPLARLDVLPRGKTPVSKWSDLDEAFYEISDGIKHICDDIQEKRFFSNRGIRIEGIYVGEGNLAIGSGKSISAFAPYRYRLSDVFVKSGFPEITFVERDDFAFLMLALEQPGRGVIIEGPSGVGKTTSVVKAIKDLKKVGLQSHASVQQLLSARKPADRDRLRALREWHDGTVVIDDFHRLNSALRQSLVDYLKELADNTEQKNKIAIIGIPHTGQALVDISFDLTTRLDVFTLGQVSHKIILQMIEKGEKALNIQLDRKADIALAANGSLNIAQFLCFYVCALAGITETQRQIQIIRCDVNKAIRQVLGDLKMKFGQSIRHFIAMGESRDVTCLRLLEELAMAEDGFLSFLSLKKSRPDLARGIDRFLQEDWIGQLYSACPEAENHLFFDTVRQALIIDDPQLGFYLKQIPFSSLAREAGKIEILAQRKVFICYSHKDADWLERLRVHLKPIEREGIIDLWDDTKVAAGLQWKEAIKNALETARVAVLLISGNFLASDFIAEHELPTLLSHVKAGGTTILPVILSPSLFTSTKLGEFQSINPPNRPVSGMTHPKQEEIFVKVAQVIIERFRAE